MLVRCICARVTEDLRNLFPAQPGLDQSSAGGSPKTAKAQSVRFTVRDASASASRLEGSLHGSYPEYRFVVAAFLCLPQCLEFKAQTIADRRGTGDRKSTRLNSSHVEISYAVFCLKKKTKKDR